MNGRKKPYTRIGLRRLKCCRCGQPARQQWRVCADGFWRPICKDCDIALNEIVLKWMKIPDWKQKIKEYRKR